MAVCQNNLSPALASRSYAPVSLPKAYDGWSRYIEALLRVSHKTPELVSLISDSVHGVADALEKLRKNIQETSTYCSPSVSMPLTELQIVLEDVLRKCYTYCEACKDLGDYGSDKEIIKDIMENLEVGKFDELKDYLEEIDDLLTVLESHFKRITTTKDVAKAGKEFEKQGHLGYVSTATVGVQSCFPVAGAGILLFSSPAGILAGDSAMGITIDAGYTQAQIAIFNDACQAVTHLDLALEKGMKITKEMHETIYKIKHIPGLGGVKKSKAKSINERIKSIQTKMGQLRDESNKLIMRLDKLH